MDSKSIHFSCTQCGKCCHDLRLPLSLDEAEIWLKDNGGIEIFVEAIPWPSEPPNDNLQAAHRRGRSFPAKCGDLPIRVIATLVASFNGPCPNLLDDMRCGAYEKRPGVCRIYPAEVNPSLELVPSTKSCPPEAWTNEKPVYVSGGRLMDVVTVELIKQARQADIVDAFRKDDICSTLGLRHCALANEGFSVFKVDREIALYALEKSRNREADGIGASEWTFVSNQRKSVDTLNSIEARCIFAAGDSEGVHGYFGFHVAAP